MKAEKLLYFESVRGMAALIVVVSHFMYTFYPQLKITSLPNRNLTPLADLITVTPLSVWHDGEFAVHTFFVLSGLVLSLSFFRSVDREKIISGAIRRYFRFSIPVFYRFF